MTQPKRTVLVDSSGSLHACFHGYPSRIAQLGGEDVEVAALYGYLAYTCRLYNEFECDRLIHVLDPEGGSDFRNSIYPEYKANRSATDPLLTRQKEIFPQLLEATGQHYICVPGVESDDIIGTLADKARKEGDHVLIISQDKDLLQLVDDQGIAMARYVQGSDGKGKLHKFYQEADVLREFGVRPNQIADYLALVGDATDNIPGVTNCGPKTAAQWLNQYGNLATIKMHAGDITGRGSKGLQECLDKIDLYQQLTTVLRNVDVDWPAPCARDEELCKNALALLNAPSTWLEVLGFPQPDAFAVRGPRF